MQFQDKVVAVTGAGSGIGRALAVEVAARGGAVAALDLNETAAKETVTALQSGRHRAYAVDVSDSGSVEHVRQGVLDDFGKVDVLINNAGVLGRVAPFTQLAPEEFEFILNVDLWGVVHCTRHFLPDLLDRPEAALANVSSLAGLMGSYGNSAYFTAKFAVRGFTETLRSELATSNVAVTVVHPGIVKTNLGGSHPGYSEQERAEAIRRYKKQPGVSPQTAARRIVKGIERGRPRVLIGPDVWMADKLVRLLPAHYHQIFPAAVRKAANAQRPDGKRVF